MDDQTKDDGTDQDPDVLFQEISELSLRLMAGAVPRRTMKDLQRIVHQQRGGYPWQQVLNRGLSDPVDHGDLINRGLRAQRDWVARGGRKDPGRSAKTHAKGLLAAVVVKSTFLVLYALAFVVLLVLMEQMWPWMDISRIGAWLQEQLPGLFARDR